MAAAALTGDVVRVSLKDIHDYRASQVKAIQIVGRAPVPLEFAAETEFVVFRGGEGLRDQVAIIVGKPDFSKPVAIRMHSACLTGDLFGSLKCDCGDQLRGTVQKMAQGEGGILLYLDQEGRGTASPTRCAPTSSSRRAGTPMTPTRCWASALTSVASTSRPRCCASSA